MVRRQFEICHHVLDLRPLEEGIPRVDHVGNVPLAELLLEGAGLGVRTVQDGEVLVFRMDLVHPLQDGRSDEGRFLLLRVGPHEADLLPFLAHRHALFRNTSFIIGNQCVGRIHDVPGGAVVALQAEGLRLREVLLEVQDVLDLGAAEGVDGLGVVPHHAQVPVHRRELLENQVLRVVGVLVLVHHDGVEPFGNRRQRIGTLLQQDVHVQEDIVEVHHPGLPAQLAIRLVHPVDLGFLVQAVVVPVAAGAVGVRRGRDQVVLRLGDAGEHESVVS